MVSYFRSTYLVKNVGVKTNGFPVELGLQLLNLECMSCFIIWDPHTQKKLKHVPKYSLFLIGSLVRHVRPSAEHESTFSRLPKAFRCTCTRKKYKLLVPRESLSVAWANFRERTQASGKASPFEYHSRMIFYEDSKTESLLAANRYVALLPCLRGNYIPYTITGADLAVSQWDLES